MIKNRTIVEMEVKGRSYRLECSSDCPLEDVIEANSLIHNFLVERLTLAQQAAKQEEAKQE